MTDEQQKPAHDFRKKDKRLGKWLPLVLLFLFAMAILVAFLQATTDTPKSGDHVPAPERAEGAPPR